MRFQKFLCSSSTAASGKKQAAKSKEELAQEKKKELEKRLQDVSGQLNNNKKPAKKGNGCGSTVLVMPEKLYVQVVFLTEANLLSLCSLGLSYGSSLSLSLVWAQQVTAGHLSYSLGSALTPVLLEIPLGGKQDLS